MITEKVFVKIDMSNPDEDPKISKIKAPSMMSLLKSEYKKFLDDSKSIPVHNTSHRKALSIKGNTLQWEPGDGGQYTIAAYVPDTPKGWIEAGQWI